MVEDWWCTHVRTYVCVVVCIKKTIQNIKRKFLYYTLINYLRTERVTLVVESFLYYTYTSGSINVSNRLTLSSPYLVYK